MNPVVTDESPTEDLAEATEVSIDEDGKADGMNPLKIGNRNASAGHSNVV